MDYKVLGIALCLLLGLSACREATNKTESYDATTANGYKSTNTVIHSSEINWEQLNPARGDQSPQAGTIWGDRKGEVPTGFLAKFVDGFSSPPHIHNITYRAVVIKGLVHNDDPAASTMWMKPGSFWTQPAGESHITSAKGEEVIALVEIDTGPYLVKPISESFDNGERPVNIDSTNIVWLDSKQTNWVGENCDAEISFLIDNNQQKSLFIKLPANFKGELETFGSVVHSVVIQGTPQYYLPEQNIEKELDPGSYFGSSDKTVHTLTNANKEEVILYIRTNGNIKIYSK